MPQTKRLELIDMVFTNPTLTASLMTRPQSAAGIKRNISAFFGFLENEFCGGNERPARNCSRNL
jgi:hypothetical protein